MMILPEDVVSEAVERTFLEIRPGRTAPIAFADRNVVLRGRTAATREAALSRRDSRRSHGTGLAVMGALSHGRARGERDDEHHGHGDPEPSLDGIDAREFAHGNHQVLDIAALGRGDPSEVLGRA